MSCLIIELTSKTESYLELALFISIPSFFYRCLEYTAFKGQWKGKLKYDNLYNLFILNMLYHDYAFSAGYTRKPQVTVISTNEVRRNLALLLSMQKEDLSSLWLLEMTLVTTGLCL